MTSINLIPAPRIQARRRRRCLRVWGCAVGGYAVALSIGAAAIVMRTPAAEETADRIADLDARVQAREASVAAIRAQLAQRQTVLRVNEAVRNQPDWSVLLAVVAAKLGEGVVLDGCSLQPQNGPAAAGKAASPALYRLSVRGFGRDQSSISSFALGLEQSGLFDRVKLLETRRTRHLAGEAISFTIECELIESPEAAT